MAEIVWTRVHVIINQACAWLTHLSEEMDGLPGDTWRRQEHLIFIAIWSRLHRTVVIFHDFGNRGAPRGYIVMVRSPSDGRRQRMTWSHLKQTEEDRTAAIKREPRSWPDRPAIGADSAPNWKPRHRQVKGHDCRAIVAINPLPRPHQTAPIFGPKFSLKSMYSLLCSSTFDRFVKELSKFWERS